MKIKSLFILLIGFVLGIAYYIGAPQGTTQEELPAISHVGYSADSPQQDWVRYAREISGGDMSFMNMLEGESGFQSITLPSKVPDWRSCTGNGHGKEDSHGLCQLNRCWHSSITDDARFNDPYWQLTQCHEKYKAGTKFFGYKAGMFVTGEQAIVETNKVKEEIKKNNASKECYFVALVRNADYVQIDNGDGSFNSIADVDGDSKDVKIFNCYGPKYYE